MTRQGVALCGLLLLAGCGDEVLCQRDTDCPAGSTCQAGACVVGEPGDMSRRVDSQVPVDLAVPDEGPPRDLAPPPIDLTPLPPDLTVDAGCAPGQKLCGSRCIRDMECCVNADCMVTGQVCQNDGTCACAIGFKVCGGTD